MTGLERRYRHLLRAYPADYRRERGEEIVGTYLDLADPGRRWPSVADAADLVRGGLRQRLRAAGAGDVVPGVRLAALLALATAAFLAAFWALAEVQPPPAAWGLPSFGPFVSIGIVAWSAWLVAVLLVLVAPGRPARLGITVAVLATTALPVVSLVLDVPRPPLYVLVPQIALGVLALALDSQPSLPTRALPITAALGGAATAAVLIGQSYWGWYGWTAEQLLPATGGVLLAVAVLLAVGLTMRQDRRGQWAVVALLTPIGLLSVHILAGMVAGLGGAPRPTYPTMIAAALAVGLLGPALLPITVALRRRRTPAPAASCPTCGPHR
ncbi:hypothetical protein ABT008_30175 [Micromonospora sp. NPDC002389]|uniref:hypothetical protein n=1 Tax=Micromonospora sp. NPDC002389 TaxID=3154272 RepID=UPI00331E0971